MNALLQRGFAPLAVLCLAPSAWCGTWFVDAGLTTGANDGSSWANAFQGPGGLQAALAAAVSGDDVFVADGTYLPSSTGVRTASFVPRNGIAIYGSFQGGESTPDERPPFGTAPSILSGDLNGDDGSNLFNDNSHHVLRPGLTNATAIVDGFVVRGGNANAGGGNNDRGGGILCVNNANALIRNCHFDGNRCVFGGGAGYINSASPSFVDCMFTNNLGGSFGGAFDIATSGAVRFDRCHFEGNVAGRAGALEIFATSGAQVTNCTFRGNTATGSNAGGALWVGSGSNPQIRNCTVVGNNATSGTAGGLSISGASVTVVNCIFWDNAGPGGTQGSANQISPGAAVTYSIVEAGYPGTGNSSADPAFVDLLGGDYALTLASPAIDAGNNAGVPAGIFADFLQHRRFFDEPSVADTGAGTAPIVDIGAFEFTTNIGRTYCPGVPNSTGFAGRLDAMGSLLVSANSVTLVATGLPANANGYFLTSRTRGFSPNPGGSTGNLCLGGSIGRFVAPGQVLNSGAGGTFALALDLTMLPQPTSLVAAQVGETWNFQAWHRDSILGFVTSNFTDGVSLTFE